MHFKKMHGLGNDFVIIDVRTQSVTLSPEQIQGICDRNFGVGCDLLAFIEPSDNADVFARFYNADGSESAACGNATRCIADIVMKEQGADQCTIKTGRGVLDCAAAGGGLVTVDMGAPKRVSEVSLDIAPSPDFAVAQSPSPHGRGWGPSFEEGWEGEGTFVDMGNPHCVLFVDDVENTPVERLGPAIERHPLFPERTNVEFVQVLDDGRLRQRTWERGVGETLACGSGACAVGVAAIRRELVDGRTVEILLNGGPIHIEWRESDGHVLMTGPVEYVFDGYLRNI